MQVNVLCPDGHRVTVKVTKQTPLLTILEEACTKRKLDPTQHALRKENDRPHVPNLDSSLTMKFAGIELDYKEKCDENVSKRSQFHLFDIMH